ncbi:leucine-rich repeat-containing protein 15-like isoform X2 [Toxorhynchites rutilus septentrionalis]|uniref:leucine-rich repeat-containing protein 15-like isoform X2 n=1 Tax=Toxorhynchites rutilus septentrionalis TaxID=329112 RepID=UPI00247AE0E6|nr:leucine-rich repeat-containing protein 15-like isoform X2 [Toxorhynchites rutilus septentrionalis]
MTYILKTTLLLSLLTTLAPLCYGREPGAAEYEPIEGICGRCACVVHRNDTRYSLLDCSTRNLTHMLASWPELFGSNERTEQEIVFSLSGNNIHSLQQLPATNASLAFSCRHCNLTALASGLFLDAPNIIRLDLSWNQLTGDVLRPDVFRGIYTEREYESIALDELDLGNNLIENLDGALFEHMVHLRRLSLTRNPIGEITEDTALALGSISRLEHLDLSHTELADIPHGIFERISGLKELLVQGNRFTTVPSAIALLKPTLALLNVGENPIQMLIDESFFDLDHLTHLNISGMSKLQDIETGTFAGLKSLEVLICSHNRQLQEFDMSDLKGLIRLHELDLSSCGLQHLHLDETIPEHDDSSDIAHIEVFPKLRSVQLEDNPWHCDCELHQSVESIKHILVDPGFQAPLARCETPYYLAAVPLTSLGERALCSAPPKRVPKIPIYEAPAFLRPRSIVLSILSVGVVLLIGFAIGFAIVCIKRKLKAADFGFTSSPVRYTTVRDSTASTILQQQA